MDRTLKFIRSNTFIFGLLSSLIVVLFFLVFSWYYINPPYEAQDEILAKEEPWAYAPKEVLCGNIKHTIKKTYPINDNGIEFIGNLGLNLCTGSMLGVRRIVAAMKKENINVRFIVVSRDELYSAQKKMRKKFPLERSPWD